MTHREADDFDHPNIAEPSPHRRHVLYRLTRTAWEAAGARHPAERAAGVLRSSSGASQCEGG